MNRKVALIKQRIARRTSGSHTPCIRNCCLNDHKVCLGCGRSLPEILTWHNIDKKQQQEIIISARNRLSSRPKII